MEPVLLIFDIVMCTLIVWLLFSDNAEDNEDTDDYN